MAGVSGVVRFGLPAAEVELAGVPVAGVGIFYFDRFILNGVLVDAA